MQKALFLDRDGVLIEDKYYLKDPHLIVPLPGVFPALRQAQSQGYKLIVVTNQSGIGRGLISLDEYQQVAQAMTQIFKSQGLDLVTYFSPYFANAQDPRFLQNPDWRKPEAGMLFQAAREHQINLSGSLLVGDSHTDLVAGVKAGLAAVYLMNSPKFSAELKAWQDWQGQHLLSATQSHRSPKAPRFLGLKDWDHFVAELG